MVHLLNSQQKQPTLKPLHFGTPVLNAFCKIAHILGCSVQLAPQPPSIPAHHNPPTAPRVSHPLPHQLKMLHLTVPLPRVPLMLPTSPSFSSFQCPPPWNHFRTPITFYTFTAVPLDASAAGKLCNTNTGKVESMDFLLAGPNSAT